MWRLGVRASHGPGAGTRRGDKPWTRPKHGDTPWAQLWGSAMGTNPGGCLWPWGWGTEPPPLSSPAHCCQGHHPRDSAAPGGVRGAARTPVPPAGFAFLFPPTFTFPQKLLPATCKRCHPRRCRSFLHCRPFPPPFPFPMANVTAGFLDLPTVWLLAQHGSVPSHGSCPSRNTSSPAVSVPLSSPAGPCSFSCPV